MAKVVRVEYVGSLVKGRESAETVEKMLGGKAVVANVLTNRPPPIRHTQSHFQDPDEESDSYDSDGEGRGGGKRVTKVGNVAAAGTRAHDDALVLRLGDEDWTGVPLKKATRSNPLYAVTVDSLLLQRARHGETNIVLHGTTEARVDTEYRRPPRALADFQRLLAYDTSELYHSLAPQTAKGVGEKRSPKGVGSAASGPGKRRRRKRRRRTRNAPPDTLTAPVAPVAPITTTTTTTVAADNIIPHPPLPPPSTQPSSSSSSGSSSSSSGSSSSSSSGSSSGENSVAEMDVGDDMGGQSSLMLPMWRMAPRRALEVRPGYKPPPDRSTTKVVTLEIPFENEEMGGVVTRRVLRETKKRYFPLHKIRLSAPHVPFYPPARVAVKLNKATRKTHESDQLIVSYLEVLFEERKVWSRAALEARLPLSIGTTSLKRLLARVAYNFDDGPWRTFWIVFGYDPRSDRDSILYQSLDVRFRNSYAHTAKKRVRGSDGFTPVATALARFKSTGDVTLGPEDVSANELALLRTKRDQIELKIDAARNQVLFQFIDLMHIPQIKAIIDKVRQDTSRVFSSRAGWLTSEERLQLQTIAKDISSSLKLGAGVPLVKQKKRRSRRQPKEQTQEVWY